jgi:uncharacterized protein (TIGR02246 family)
MTTEPQSHDADHAAVRDLYHELIEGWNEGSGARFAAAFTEDGDLVAFDGTHLRGRSLIAEFQQELFDKWVKGTRLTGTIDHLRFLDANTAIMHATGGTIMRRKTKPARARESIQTLVAVRTSDGWRLAAFQNTRVRPMGSGFLAFLHWSIGDAVWGLLRLSTDSTVSTAQAHTNPADTNSPGRPPKPSCGGYKV